ncbi:small kinetochore-associated protein isoform X2 [Amia ocellicauda]|uniref:small kinetochore-associated protein isoform X2 n=1 Tax=Amia ocellicauda TaxID=2972642 RepID=UPI003463BE7D
MEGVKGTAEREVSRIPVYQDNASKKLLEGNKSSARPAETMKRNAAHRFELRDLPDNFNFAKSDNVGAFKAHASATSQRKKPQTNIYKGPSARLRVETELRDKNQLLEAANLELYKNLSEAKENIVQLEQRYTQLEGESGETKQQLETCMLILEAGNIDAVSGGRIFETTKENEQQRREAMSVSRDLRKELEDFNEKVAEHRLQMEGLRSRGMALKENRERYLEDKEDFETELEKMEKELKEAQQLINM